MKKRYLITLGVTTYLIALVAYLPAQFVVDMAVPSNHPQLPQVVHSQGTLWTGMARLNDKRLGIIDLGWDLSALSLVTGSMSMAIDAEAKGSSVKGLIETDGLLAPSSVTLKNLDVYVTSNLANQVIKPMRASMSGDIEATELNMMARVNPLSIRQAEGRVIWYGGQVNYFDRGKSRSVELPSLYGDLRSQQDTVQLNVTTADNESLIDGTLKPDGWASLAIKKRFLDLAKLPWNGKEQPDDVVFQVSEKVIK